MGSGKSTARIGCDIGGTFTDIVLTRSDGQVFVNKTSTTPDKLSDAIVQGVSALLKQANVLAENVEEIVHGTTTASNTILQRVGAKTALLTTKGFRDVLEIARIRTPTMFDLAWQKPKPLVPRRYRRAITERIDTFGTVLTPIDLDEVRATLNELVAEGVESVAVCFLNSYVNPEHELMVKAVIEKEYPSVLLSVSCEVLPEIKEYERTSTTVVNAYILPAMRSYLATLRHELQKIGVNAPLQVMASNGGMMGALAASEKPVYAVASGPAGGVAGAAMVGRLRQEDNLIVFDMGGTTAKASIVTDGMPALTNEYEFRDGISSPSRFIKGGGYVLKVPAIDIAEVGAGGGSIANIDSGGLLVVGPASAGAFPGPACYGNGNPLPTVTDANMLLGYLNPEALAGGSLSVLPSLSASAIDEHVAQPLGLSVKAAAHGIRQVANVNMARAIRSVTIERGRDPREMTMIATGGGGPLHAVDVAKLLGIRRVIAPVMAGVFCSVGMLGTNAEHNFVKAVLKPIEQCDQNWVAEQYAALEALGRQALADEGYSAAQVSLSYLADVRYMGQSSELTVTVTSLPSEPTFWVTLAAVFNEEYARTFGYSSDEPLELVNLRVSATGVNDRRLSLLDSEIDKSALQGSAGVRAVSFSAEEDNVQARLLPRSAMDHTVQHGPLIIESYDTTIIVPPDAQAWADEVGNIIIEIVGDGDEYTN